MVKSLERPRSIGEWRLQFLTLLSSFITPDESSEREYTAITTLAEQIAECAALAEFTGDAGPAIIISWFRSRLEQQDRNLACVTEKRKSGHWH